MNTVSEADNNNGAGLTKDAIGKVNILTLFASKIIGTPNPEISIYWQM